MKGRKGFTLVEIMIVVAIIGLLAAIAIPSFIKARTESQKNACINNLRQIDSAKEQWALNENQPADATPVDTDLDAYIKGTTTNVVCPAAGSAGTFASSYTINSLQYVPACLVDATNHVISGTAPPAG